MTLRLAVISFVALRVNRPGFAADVEQAVTVALAAGRRARALLREDEFQPEAPEEFDRAETDGIEHEQIENREKAGRFESRELDHGEKQESAHQAADQPGEAAEELALVPANESEVLHDRVVHGLRRLL